MNKELGKGESANICCYYVRSPLTTMRMCGRRIQASSRIWHTLSLSLEGKSTDYIRISVKTNCEPKPMAKASSLNERIVGNSSSSSKALGSP